MLARFLQCLRRIRLFETWDLIESFPDKVASRIVFFSEKENPLDKPIFQSEVCMLQSLRILPKWII
jgi:hypothetical protein